MGLFAPDGRGEAVLSDCGLYRYLLTREWSGGKGWCGWIMLNPSVADAQKDDATIRKCMGFSKRWGYQGLLVANLFAVRSTDPKLLRSFEHPVTERDKPDRNFDAMYHVLTTCDITVLAWGTPGADLGVSADFLTFTKDKFPDRVRVLGFNQDGTPTHPLMVSYSVYSARGAVQRPPVRVVQ